MYMDVVMIIFPFWNPAPQLNMLGFIQSPVWIFHPAERQCEHN